tara:strand:- start:15714 stop:16229 length:516 start_codon:yes stop_codon:yes gene_type:complete
MKKGLLIFVAILLTGAVAYCAVFRWSYAHTAMMSQSQDAELEWLRHEFSLSADQFETVRELHAAHDLECLRHCEALALSNDRLFRLMRESTEITPEIETALQAATELREECRRSTLRHIYEVSQHMNTESAQRYRETMTARLVDSGLHHRTAISPTSLDWKGSHGHQPANH